MNDFFKGTAFKVILCLLALMVGFVIYSVVRGGDIGGPEGVLGTILAPVQKLSQTISDKVQSTIDMFVNADEYYEENRRLREENAELNERLTDYYSLKEKYGQLSEMMGLKEQNPDYTFSDPCTVIARVTNDPYGSFMIDKGSYDGVSLYDPVITSEGLLGIIIEISGTYSKVQTLYSPSLSVGVYAVETGDTGVVSGGMEYAEDGLCIMKYIDRDAKIAVGNLVVTSGSSGLFPSGRPVGKVVEVGMEESGISRYAVIEPIADISHSTTVFVITDFLGQGETLG